MFLNGKKYWIFLWTFSKFNFYSSAGWLNSIKNFDLFATFESLGDVLRRFCDVMRRIFMNFKWRGLFVMTFYLFSQLFSQHFCDVFKRRNFQLYDACLLTIKVDFYLFLLPLKTKVYQFSRTKRQTHNILKSVVFFLMVGSQCDQIRHFLKFLAIHYLSKIDPNIWWDFGLFLKH